MSAAPRPTRADDADVAQLRPIGLAAGHEAEPGVQLLEATHP